ncbi:MAG: hypothetical protein IPJ26_14065 [Bacteroidetes bacterium]|nr:hypothetical protein [Bacteroidota bacterium]
MFSKLSGARWISSQDQSYLLLVGPELRLWWRKYCYPTVNTIGTYTVTVTSNGCTATDQVEVTSNTTAPRDAVADQP